MNSQQMKIWDYISKFNKNNEQIAQKINPFLKSIRQNHINSYLQLNNLNIQKSHLSHFKIQKEKNQVFQTEINNKNNHNKQLLNSTNKQLLTNTNTQLSNTNNTQLLNNNNKNFYIRSNQSKLTKKSLIQQKKNHPKISSLIVRKQNSSLQQNNMKQFLSRTLTPNHNHQKNIKKYSTSIPKTADPYHHNFIINPQKNSQFQQIEEYDFLKLKMLVKNPHFGGGKTSKFKTHLFSDINIQQIQKSFYKSPQNMTNYKQFYQKTLKKYSQILSEGKTQTRANKFDRNSRNLFFVKQQNKNQSKQQIKLKDQTCSKDFKKQENQQYRINSRKISVRTRFCQKKSSKIKGTSNLLLFKSNLFNNNSIQVTGKSKNISGQKFKSLIEIK